MEGGGRVTELVARPLLSLLLPHLAGVHQPLSGEYGGRRDVLEQLPFVQGQKVERIPDGIWMFGGPLSAAKYIDALVPALGA